MSAASRPRTLYTLLDKLDKSKFFEGLAVSYSLPAVYADASQPKRE
jgi:hypothetical protein